MNWATSPGNQPKQDTSSKYRTSITLYRSLNVPCHCFFFFCGVLRLWPSQKLCRVDFHSNMTGCSGVRETLSIGVLEARIKMSLGGFTGKH